MRLTSSCRLAIALLGGMCAFQASAIEPYQEYRKHIESAQNLTALKDDLMGDSVSLYNGKTDFAVTDVSLPGNNGLPVELRRHFSAELDLVGGNSYNANLDGVGGWEVDVPNISGTFPATGWGDTRCSGHMVPTYPPAFQLTEIWQGNQVHIPGAGDRTMLGLNADTPRPSDGIARKWTTAQRDAIDCIPMKAGMTGEGFRLKTTEGVSYYFDTATSRLAGTLDRSAGEGGRARTSRNRVYVQASKVEDRFGNWVQYSYNSEGKPVRIWSSDGREIVLAYTGSHLATATAAGRTWSYSYGSVDGQKRLTRVLLPDGSAWSYGYSSALRVDPAPWDGNSRPNCAEQPPAVAGELTMTIGHPSGAVGTFKLENMRHGRSGVHLSECLQRVNNSVNEPSSYYYVLGRPFFFDVVSLKSKTIIGPGLPKALTWAYDYGNGGEAMWGSRAAPAVYPCTTCKQEKRVVVSNPDGTRIVYSYGVLFGANEGRLLGTITLDSAGNTASARSSVYMTTAEADAQPFASRYGLIFNGDDPSSAEVRPVVAEAIDQDGESYQTSMLSFDSLARPMRINKSSALGSRTDTITYMDSTNLWVMGQTAKVTNVDTGAVEAETRFDSLARPIEERAFGKLKQSLSYNTDGTIASVTDALGNVTSLSSWKRGTPQQILFADGTSQAAAVDDNGWIQSVTDETGATTQYGYDRMGRVASIDWPANDSVAWVRTTQTFSAVSADEFGIPAGHWRQSTVTGNARKNVYFDAFWRPLLTEEFDNESRSATQRYQRFAYDESGRQVFASYPGTVAALSSGTWSAYDALGRVRSVSVDSEVGLLTALTEYQSGGRVKVADARGNITVTRFQAFGEPSSEAPTQITHPEGVVTEIARDVFGKPTSIVRRNQDGSTRVSRNYVYDANQRFCKSIEPETGSTLMGYDNAGNLVWSASGLNLTSTKSCDMASATIDARRVTRGYDARNRLKTLRFPDGNGDQDWTYTPDGKPATVATSNEAGSARAINTYGYNKRRLLVSETSSDSILAVQSVGYAYNSMGALAGLTYPSGRYVDYAPNALGQPTKAGSFITNVAYYPNGGMKQFTYGNGIVHTMQQNARQLPTRVTDSRGVIDTTYEFDAGGNVARILDHLDGSRTRTMSYDGLDRLVQASSASFGGDGVFRYTYDAVDNLRSATLAGVKDHNYWYDAKNRLTNVQSSAGATIIGLTYDVQGNLSKRSGTVYTFDFGNRLRQVADAERYRYDAHGRRILSVASNGGGIIRSLYGNDGALLRQDNAREGKNTEYIQLNGSLVARAISVVSPLTPVLTVPSFSSTGSFTVSWSSVAYASTYELREQVAGGEWKAIQSGSARSWNASAKAEGSFGYSVRACQQNACSAWSAASTVAVQRPPSAVAVLTVPASALNGTYSVTWSAIASAATYRLQEQVGTGAWATVQETAARTWSASGKAAGSYGYRVYGCNPAGCGPASTVVKTTALYPPSGAPSVTVPGQSLGGSYSVSWNALAGATRYGLEESVNGGGWAAVASAASTSQAFSGKSTGSYAYRVRGGNDAGWGAYSATAMVSVIQPPAAPGLSGPAASGTGSANLSWNAVQMAVSYSLEQSINGGGWAVVQSDGSTQATRTGLGYATYTYRVKACNAAGCSGYSNSVAVVSSPPPATPTILSSVKVQWIVNRATKIRCEAKWTPVEGASTYEFQVYGGGVQYSGPATSISSQGAGYCAPSHVVRACNTNGCSAWSNPPTVQGLNDLGDLTNPL